MKKRLNTLSKAAISGLVLTAALSSTAFAETYAYLIKDGETIYSYDKSKLTNSFLDSKTGNPSPLYNDFKANLEVNSFYAFHDNINGFVDYAAISDAFIANRSTFKLDSYTETCVSKANLLNYDIISTIADGKIAYTSTANIPVNVAKGKLSATFVGVPDKDAFINDSLFDVATVTLTATEGDTLVTGLKITRTGLSSDSTLEGAMVWLDSTWLNTQTIFSNGVADITFQIPLRITKSESKDLNIKINISNKAKSGEQLKFSLDNASSIKSNAQVSGVFPATSGTFTIVKRSFN